MQIHAYTYIYVHIRTYTYILYLAFGIALHIYTCIYMHIHAYTCIYIHIHAYTCIYMHIRSYTCIYYHICAYSEGSMCQKHVVNSLMMGWAAIDLQMTVVSLLRNTGSGETSAPAYPWQISYISPRLMAPYWRFRPCPSEKHFSNSVYCRFLNRLARRSS